MRQAYPQRIETEEKCWELRPQTGKISMHVQYMSVWVWPSAVHGHVLAFIGIPCKLCDRLWSCLRHFIELNHRNVKNKCRKKLSKKWTVERNRFFTNFKIVLIYIRMTNLEQHFWKKNRPQKIEPKSSNFFRISKLYCLELVTLAMPVNSLLIFAWSFFNSLYLLLVFTCA